MGLLSTANVAANDKLGVHSCLQLAGNRKINFSFTTKRTLYI